MKKQSPSASTVEKVTLRPTEVGAHVIDRLKRPGTDKSALLRHLVELGFACEQAGFILDGNVLRHAGSVWHVQPQLGAAVAEQPAESNAAPAAAPQTTRREKPRSQASTPSAVAPTAVLDSGVSQEPTAQATADGSLAARLRGLSG